MMKTTGKGQQDPIEPADWRSIGLAISAVVLSVAKVGLESDPNFAQRLRDELVERMNHLKSLDQDHARLMLVSAEQELSKSLSGRSKL